ncbi:unnamed protein product, partial [Urochloa humidicola]
VTNPNPPPCSTASTRHERAASGECEACLASLWSVASASREACRRGRARESGSSGRHALVGCDDGVQLGSVGGPAQAARGSSGQPMSCRRCGGLAASSAPRG